MTPSILPWRSAPDIAKRCWPNATSRPPSIGRSRVKLCLSYTPSALSSIPAVATIRESRFTRAVDPRLNPFVNRCQLTDVHMSHSSTVVCMT